MNSSLYAALTRGRVSLYYPVDQRIDSTAVRVPHANRSGRCLPDARYAVRIWTMCSSSLGVARPVRRIMTSSGGLVRADLFQPKDSLLSGPAGGVIGAVTVSDSILLSPLATTDSKMLSDTSGILTLDMGGTSTDVAIGGRIHGGGLDYRFSTKIGPFDLQLPSLAIETVAAGGGSICWFDGTAITGWTT